MKAALALAFTLALRAAAQLPEAPRPHLDRAEWALLTVDAGSRALDTYSTRRALAQGDHEMFLPGFVVNRTWTLAAYSGGAVGLDWFAVRQLERHRYARLAHAVPVIDVASNLPWAIHNLYLGRPRPSFNPSGPRPPARR
jgi:hypothetical protein